MLAVNNDSQSAPPREKELKKRVRQLSPSHENSRDKLIKTRRVQSPLSKATNETSRDKVLRPRKVPVNNRLIDDFFQSTVQKLNAYPDTRSPESPTTLIASLQEKCQELERICQDKEEQLRAVSNNRTIVHSALQAALNKREKELASIKEEKEENDAKVRKIVEEFVKKEIDREAKDQREKLATDGARLGRIVYTRAGMRSVETWEEGYSSLQISARRAELQRKRKILERRRSLAEEASNCIANGERFEEFVGGIEVKNKFDAIEAIESVRYHLENIRKEERDLSADEQSLNDEKAAHIRALKCVASEDASRFRTRPTVSFCYCCCIDPHKGYYISLDSTIIASRTLCFACSPW